MTVIQFVSPGELDKNTVEVEKQAVVFGLSYPIWIAVKNGSGSECR